MIRILWRLFRPHTLTASFVPVLLGTALAWTQAAPVRWDLLAAMLVASTLIQAATNMFNEYFDYVRGVDDEASVGIAGAITQDKIRPRVVLATALASLASATLLGVYLCAETSWLLMAVGLVCMLVGYLYTGGPYPIAATPFGELFSGGFMGLGITLIAYFLQRGAVGLREIAVAVPVALLIAAILTANNIRDRVGDAASGRRTLAILLGHKGAVIFLASLLLGANLWAVGLTLSRVVTSWTLLALLSLWPGVAAVRAFLRGGAPAAMMPAMQRVAQTNTVFGLLFTVGLLLGGVRGG